MWEADLGALLALRVRVVCCLQGLNLPAQITSYAGSGLLSEEQCIAIGGAAGTSGCADEAGIAAE